jgi:hypothetical protein
MEILRVNPLLSPKHDVAAGGIQACREQRAATLWIDSGRCTLPVGALKQLTPVARIALCTTLGLPASPVAPAAQAARILQHVNDKKAAAGNSAQVAGGHPDRGGGAAQAAAPPHNGAVEQALPVAAPAPVHPPLELPPAARDTKAHALYPPTEYMASRMTTGCRSGHFPGSTRSSPLRSETRHTVCHDGTLGSWSRARASLSPTIIHEVR